MCASGAGTVGTYLFPAPDLIAEMLKRTRGAGSPVGAAGSPYRASRGVTDSPGGFSGTLFPDQFASPIGLLPFPVDRSSGRVDGCRSRAHGREERGTPGRRMDWLRSGRAVVRAVVGGDLLEESADALALPGQAGLPVGRALGSAGKDKGGSPPGGLWTRGQGAAFFRAGLTGGCGERWGQK